MVQQDAILIADDVELNRAMLGSIFDGHYQILEAENGEQARELVYAHGERIAAILLDLIMPKLDGFELLSILKDEGFLKSIPVIIISSDASYEKQIKAFDLGAADVVKKPFEPGLVVRRVNNAIELSKHKHHLQEIVDKQTEAITVASDKMLTALAAIIEFRSLETGMHNSRISLLSEAMLTELVKMGAAPELTVQEVKVMSKAAVLHDIGKVAVPDNILNKPGRFTPEEFEIMKTHSAKGADMIKALQNMGAISDQKLLQYAYLICRHHHERYDGKGYPDALKGEEIPLCAQAVAIADCYDALTSVRCYKAAYTPEVALQMIIDGECGEFSERMINALKNCFEIFREIVTKYADKR